MRPLALALLALLLAGVGPIAPRALAQERGLAVADGADPPRISLAEALLRAADVDPGYVAALHQVGDATWRRRSAFSAFVLPTLSFQSTATRFSSDIFNVGTSRETDQIVNAQLTAAYELFRGGGKVAELGQARAELDGAHANRRQAQFETALQVEADYYDVLAQRELERVARERVRRAEEQLEVARARVLSGAAVQSDSLQIVLELTRARVDLLRQESALRVSRFQLGRRVGHEGPVDAVPLDTLPAPPLPIDEGEAIAEALQRSPRALAVRAGERSAEAGFGIARAAYVPRLDLTWQWTGTDESFFPTATTRSALGLQITVPLWNNGQRELDLSRARTARAIARAERGDEERAIRRDVVEAYQAYETARASAGLALQGVAVARENLRVQDERYRAGATTIIDLVTAQVDLAEAGAELVQARQASRLALAGLEAALGRRLFPVPTTPSDP